MANRIPDKNTSKVYEFYTFKMVDATKTYGDVLCISLDNWNYIERLKVNNKVTVISDRYNIYNDYTYTDETDLWDFLKDMKFDKIIMNPPYNRNLHLKILSKAIEHLKDENSECVNLSPIRWLQDPLVKYKKHSDYKKFGNSILNHIENVEEISSDIGSQLFNIRLNITLGIYECKKSLVKNVIDPSNTLLDKILAKTDKNTMENAISFGRPMNFSVVISLIRGGANGGTENCSSWMIEREKAFYINDRNIFSGKTYKEYRDSVIWGNLKSKSEVTHIEFDSAKEAENFYNSCETIFFRYVFKMELVDVNVHSEFLPWMGDAINPRTGLKGYESEWTDADFYKYFDITSEEQKIIEETMKEYV